MDVGDDTTTGDGGLDEGVELLVTTDGELEMAGRDTLDLEVLAGVSGELEDLGGQVLKDGGRVDGGGGTDTLGLLDGGLEETVDTTDGELSSLCSLIFKRYGYGGDEKGDEMSRKRRCRCHMFSGVPLVGVGGVGGKFIVKSTRRARNQNQRSNFEVSSGRFDSPEVQPWTNATGAPSWRWGPCRPFLPYLLCLLCRTVNRDGNVEERERRESWSWVSHHASRCKLANNTGKRYRTRSSTIRRWIRSDGVPIGSAWCRPRRPRNFRRRRGSEDRRCAVQSAHHG